MSEVRYTPAVTAVVAANGTASAVLIPSVRTGQTVRISRCTVGSTDPADPGEARLYRNSATPGNFLDGTASSNQDVAEYPNPITFSPGESMLVVWLGSTVGATVSANAEGTVTSGV